MPTVYTVNAFSKQPHGGNPAGVVLDVTGLSESNMKTIALKVGFSETAFVFPSAEADWEVRFFTPLEEVDLCGHATIATFHTLAQQLKIPAGRYRQKTKAGILDVEIQNNGSVLMTQTPPRYGACISDEVIAQSLGIPIEDLLPGHPCQIVSTGLPDIIVPIRDLKTLHAIQPDFSMVSEVSAAYDVTGYHLFCLETLENHTAHCRNLAPRVGIDEESATGTASGALACYLSHHGIVSESTMSFEQGHCMSRPSLIQVNLNFNATKIERVRVGGFGVLTGSLLITQN